MLTLDPRTIIFLAGVMGGVMSIVLLALRRNFPPTINGLAEWAAGPAVTCLATLLLAARGVIPNVLSMVLGNLLILAGLALLYVGTRKFLGRPPRIWHSALFVLSAAPLLIWYAVVAPHYGMFLSVISLYIACLAVAHIHALIRHAGHSFASVFTISALVILTLTQVFRFYFSLGLPETASFFSVSPTQAALISLYAFMTLMIPVGMVLMATDRLRRELELIASHDALTGALTRRALMSTCEQELERCQRVPRNLSLLMFDLDHFKSINDIHGHLEGDRVLARFVELVKGQVRRPDVVGRFGGEEFVALLPETSLDGALVVAERIRAHIAGAPVQPFCTVSIGATVCHADERSITSILARADNALYRAKSDGRNCVRAEP